MSATVVSHWNPDSLLIYFLAAPEDEGVCREVQKHLSPMVRFPKFPIEMKSDFDITPGLDREQHKAQVLQADIVLALISADFVANDALYARVERVFERSNNHETAVISILVRNFLWKLLPPVFLPMLPQNHHAITDRRHWPSEDVAVAEVVQDVIERITDFAETVDPMSLAASSGREATEGPIIHGDPSPVQHPPPATPSRRDAPVPSAQPRLVNPPFPGAGPPAFDRARQSLRAESPDPPQSALRPIARPTEASPGPDPRMPIFGRTPPRSTNIAPSVLQQRKPPPPPSPGSAPVLQPHNVDIDSFRASLANTNSTVERDWRPKYYRRVLWRRGLAYLIDTALFWVLILFASALMDDPVGAVELTSIVYLFGVPAFEASSMRGTPGKRVLNLEITHRDGRQISYGRSFVRIFLRTAVFYSYVFVIGLIIQYFRFKKTKKLLHDELSTTVIGDRQDGP